MRYALVLVLLSLMSATACSKPAPKSIDELRAAERKVSLVLVGEIDGGRDHSLQRRGGSTLHLRRSGTSVRL